MIIRRPEHGDAGRVMGQTVGWVVAAMIWRDPSVVGDEELLVAVGCFDDGGVEVQVDVGAEIL
jgi:hypothetical protein